MPVQSTVAGSVDFGVWGQRRTGANLQTPTPELNVGFTGHVHDDELGLINMGGRMYDPALHRFMSPDPFVPTPAHGPSWNRYAYEGEQDSRGSSAAFWPWLAMGDSRYHHAA